MTLSLMAIWLDSYKCLGLIKFSWHHKETWWIIATLEFFKLLFVEDHIISMIETISKLFSPQISFVSCTL